jgi:hypothetical protein
MTEIDKISVQFSFPCQGQGIYSYPLGASNTVLNIVDDDYFPDIVLCADSQMVKLYANITVMQLKKCSHFVLWTNQSDA